MYFCLYQLFWTVLGCTFSILRIFPNLNLTRCRKRHSKFLYCFYLIYASNFYARQQVRKKKGASGNPPLVMQSCYIIVSFSGEVFQVFSIFGRWFCQNFKQIVSVIVKTLRNTRLGASRCFKMKKAHFRSKAPFLKLPNVGSKF